MPPFSPPCRPRICLAADSRSPEIEPSRDRTHFPASGPSLLLLSRPPTGASAGSRLRFCLTWLASELSVICEINSIGGARMAGGYGDGRVTIGQYLVGRVAVTDITAVAALSPRIRFGLSWTQAGAQGRLSQAVREASLAVCQRVRGPSEHPRVGYAHADAARRRGHGRAANHVTGVDGIGHRLHHSQPCVSGGANGIIPADIIIRQRDAEAGERCPTATMGCHQKGQRCPL